MTETLEFKADAQSQALLTEYTQGQTPKKVAFVNSTKDRRIAKVNFEFEAQGDIISSDYGYSILCKFVEPEDLEFFEEVEKKAAKFLPKDIAFKSILKEEKIFIKLSTKDGKFTARTDPLINPDQLDKSNVHQGSLLDVELQPNIWINFERRSAGLYLKIFDITINGGKRKIAKRR
jgi:hypothetical protein